MKQMLIDSLKIKLILEAKPGEDPFLVRSILKRWLRNSITNFAIFLTTPSILQFIQILGVWMYRMLKIDYEVMELLLPNT